MAQGIARQFERMGGDYRFLQEGQLSIENAQRYLYKVPLYDAAHERLILPSRWQFEDFTTRRLQATQHLQRVTETGIENILEVKKKDILPINLRTNTALDEVPPVFDALFGEETAHATGYIGVVGTATLQTRADLKAQMPFNLGEKIVAMPIVIQSHTNGQLVTESITALSSGMFPGLHTADPFLALPKGVHDKQHLLLVNRALGLFAGISALSKQIAWYSEQDWSRYEGRSEGVRRVIYEQITEGQFIPTLIALTDTINQLMNMNAHLGKLSGMDDISQRFVNSLFLSSAYAMYPLELLEEKITHERTVAGKPEKIALTGGEALNVEIAAQFLARMIMDSFTH